MDDGQETLHLTRNEALVLLEVLGRLGDSQPGVSTELVLDRVELQVLWDVENMIEASLDVVFSKKYRELLEAARAEIAARSGVEMDE